MLRLTANGRGDPFLPPRLPTPRTRLPRLRRRHGLTPALRLKKRLKTLKKS